MGITGLLPFIKNSCRPANLRDFKGANVAIDAYSWLHKGAFSCAEKLVKGEKTDGYVFYCAKLLNMLLDVGVKPIMVFDGANLPSKSSTEKKRRENREKARRRGKELLCEGKIKEARECFQRCVDVTPEMAKEVVQMCKKKNVDCIVAPYEADAQLAYLNRIGMAQIIITEDSDLVLFGCDKILFKMDSFGGGLLYEQENLPVSLGSNASKFSFEKFRFMCILSGCDYLPSLPGIGLGKACKFFMLTNNPDLVNVLRKLPSYLKMPKLEVTEEYIDSFVKANNTFLYQLVYCPKKKGLVPLNPYPEGINAKDMEYAGKYLPDDVAVELACGNINVKTMERFKDSENLNSSFDPKKSVVWGIPEVKPVKKTESAFLFNSHKVKNVKRKAEVIDTPNKNECHRIEDTKEDLFSMYRNTDSRRDVLEEDPLADVCKKKTKLSSFFPPPKAESNTEPPEIPHRSSKLSLKRIVKSRFFVSPSENLKSLPILRENSPENVCNKDPPSVHPDIPDADSKMETKTQSPVKFNKENILHRFAKKKTEPKSPSTIASVDITESLKKIERSWIDSIDTESPVTTSSSAPTPTLASLDTYENSIHSVGNLKINKTKLISTKILDFKWKPESSLKHRPNSSLRSDGNSMNESITDSECEEVYNSKNDSSFNSSAMSLDNESPANSASSVILNDLPSSSSCSISSDLSHSQSSSSSRAVILKSSDSSSSSKSGKCRQLGLSKKSKSSNKKVCLQDTLLAFHFVRKPKSEVPAPT